LRNYRAASQH